MSRPSASHPSGACWGPADRLLDPPRGAALDGARWSARVARNLRNTHGRQATQQAIVDLAAEATRVDLVVLVGLHPTRQLPEVLAATDHPLAERVVQAQREVGTAPSWQAMLDGIAVVVPDLTAESRWQQFGERVAETTSITGVAAFPLLIDQESTACLTLYNKQPESFRAADLELISIFADHAAVAFEHASTLQTANQLQTALEHARVIGAAVGIVMERGKTSQAVAFGILRTASQDHNRKLYDIAIQVVETGEIPR